MNKDKIDINDFYIQNERITYTFMDDRGAFYLRNVPAYSVEYKGSHKFRCTNRAVAEELISEYIQHGEESARLFKKIDDAAGYIKEHYDELLAGAIEYAEKGDYIIEETNTQPYTVKYLDGTKITISEPYYVVYVTEKRPEAEAGGGYIRDEYIRGEYMIRKKFNSILDAEAYIEDLVESVKKR